MGYNSENLRVIGYSENANFEDDSFQLDEIQPALKALLSTLEAHRRFNEERNVQLPNHNAFIGHFLLSGAPGTGKTSAAKLLMRSLFSMGLIEKDLFKTVTRKDLVGEYIGHTAQKTASVIEACRGGVLLVDEAYTLYRGDDNTRDFGIEALETIMQEMDKNEVVIIFSGYRKELQRMQQFNPGLENRIKWRMDFDTISLQNLLKFASYYSKLSGYKITTDGNEHLSRHLQEQMSHEGFAYLRSVKYFLDHLMMNKPKLYEVTRDRKLLNTISQADFDGIWRRTNDVALKKAQDELNGLIGLNRAKQIIESYLNIVDYNMMRRKLGLQVHRVASHLVFSGNPGTGKTTTARLLGRILGAKGYLSLGHLVEVGRQDLVATISGGTAIKTNEKIKEAMGGILFIDEAYSLIYDERDAFGREAVDTLVKEMENQRDDLIIIFAGYSQEMKTLIERNPGLRSRIAETIIFEDYTQTEFQQIVNNLIEENGYVVSDKNKFGLVKLCNIWYQNHGASGNGRAARNLYEKLLKAHAKHCISMDRKQLNEKTIQVIQLETLNQLMQEMEGGYEQESQSMARKTQ